MVLSPATQQYQQQLLYHLPNFLSVFDHRDKWQRQSDCDKSSKGEMLWRTNKVLIVENKAGHLESIQTMLEEHKVAFDIAKNGLMALERYKRQMQDGG